MALLAADSLLKVPPCLLPVGVSWWLSGKEHACNAGDTGLIPGLGRSPGGRHGNPLQYSCWENPMERGACQAMGPWDHKESDMTEVTEHRKIEKQLW